MTYAMNRRRFLGTAGSGLAAAMLGGAVPLGGGRSVTAQDGTTEFHSAWPYVDPGAGGHYNTFVANGIMNPPNIYGDLMWVPGGLQYWADLSWWPLVLESWEFLHTGYAGATTPGAMATPVGGNETATPVAAGTPAVPIDADTLQVRIRPGVVWSDGTSVTAQDYIDTFDLLRLQSNTVWDYVGETEALDDLTLNFFMKQPSTVVERYVVRASARPTSVYGDFASRARDVFASGASNTDAAWTQLLQQFNEYRPTDQVVNGPFVIDPASITNAQMDLVRNESSYWANDVAFDKIVNYNGETDTISAVVLNRDIDYATHGFAPATELQMMEDGIRVLRPPTYSGAAIKYNFGVLPHFLDKRVRQALAHAVDRSEVAYVALAESGLPVEYMMGMADRLSETWLMPDVVNQLNHYVYEEGFETASALLEEAGWTKNGDVWSDPDGVPVNLELSFPAEWATHQATGSNVAEQLTLFGFPTAARPITYTQIGTDVADGNFQVVAQTWGASTNPHPHYSFVAAFFTQNTRTDSPDARGIDFPLVQQVDALGGEIDLDALVVETGEGMSHETQAAKVSDAAVAFNELVHILPVYERLGNNPALEGVRVQAWPPDDDPIYQNSPYADGIVTILLLNGTLQPV